MKNIIFILILILIVIYLIDTGTNSKNDPLYTNTVFNTLDKTDDLVSTTVDKVIVEPTKSIIKTIDNTNLKTPTLIDTIDKIKLTTPSPINELSIKTPSIIDSIDRINFKTPSIIDSIDKLNLKTPSIIDSIDKIRLGKTGSKNQSSEYEKVTDIDYNELLNKLKPMGLSQSTINQESSQATKPDQIKGIMKEEKNWSDVNQMNLPPGFNKIAGIPNPLFDTSNLTNEQSVILLQKTVRRLMENNLDSFYESVNKDKPGQAVKYSDVLKKIDEEQIGKMFNNVVSGLPSDLVIGLNKNGFDKQNLIKVMGNVVDDISKGVETKYDGKPRELDKIQEIELNKIIDKQCSTKVSDYLEKNKSVLPYNQSNDSAVCNLTIYNYLKPNSSTTSNPNNWSTVPEMESPKVVSTNNNQTNNFDNQNRTFQEIMLNEPESKSVIRDESKGVMKSEQRNEMRSEQRNEMRSEQRNEMRSEQRNEMRSEQRGEMRSEQRGEMRGEMRDESKSGEDKNIKIELEKFSKRKLKEMTVDSSNKYSNFANLPEDIMYSFVIKSMNSEEFASFVLQVMFEISPKSLQNKDIKEISGIFGEVVYDLMNIDKNITMSESTKSLEKKAFSETIPYLKDTPNSLSMVFTDGCKNISTDPGYQNYIEKIKSQKKSKSNSECDSQLVLDFLVNSRLDQSNKLESFGMVTESEFNSNSNPLYSEGQNVISFKKIEPNKKYYIISCPYEKNDCFFDALNTYGYKLDESENSVENSCLMIPCTYDVINEELNKLNEKGLKKNKYGDGLRIFMINNTDLMASKIGLWYYLKSKYGEEIASTMIPYTWDLNNESDMQRFKKSYDSKKLYITKNNKQRQEGIKIHNNLDSILNAKNEYLLVQELLQNPYTISKRKINLRIYVLMIKDSKGNIRVRVYKNGFMYYTPEFFEPNDPKFEKNITTGYIDRQVYIDNPLTHDDFRKYLDDRNRDLTSVENYLVNELGIRLSEYVFMQIYLLISRLFEAYEDKLGTSNDGVNFQLYGVDIAIDDNLKPMIMEVNKGPDLSAKDERDKDLKFNLSKDILKSVGLVPYDNTNFITVLEVANINGNLIKINDFLQNK